MLRDRHQGWKAIQMTERVIHELQTRNHKNRLSLEHILEPEIDRLDTLSRAASRLLPEDPERWKPVSMLYHDLSEILREEAMQMEEEILLQQELVEALKEDLHELESLLRPSSCG